MRLGIVLVHPAENSVEQISICSGQPAQAPNYLYVKILIAAS
jgi:hypothetical protein